MIVSVANPRTSRVFGLDVLRACAIASVLIAHAWPSVEWVATANMLGILGVELFFVLSGFLIGGILIRQAEAGLFHTWQALVLFLSRRWFRTLPSYYLFLAAHMAWRAHVLGFPDVLVSQASFLIFCQNPQSLFFPETWSLVVEEWFYLGFSLVLWLGLRIVGNFRRVLIAVVLLFWIVPTVLRIHAVVGLVPHPDLDLARAWDGYLRKTTVFRFDALMYGVTAAALAAWFPEGWRRSARCWPAAAGLLGLVAGSFAFGVPLDRSQPVQGLWLWPLMSASLAGLLPWASGYSPEGASLFRSSIEFIARISYSLYLAHGLVILVLLRLFRSGHAPLLAKHTAAWSMVAILLSTAVAWAAYSWFERPTTGWRDRFLPARASGLSTRPPGL